jgi:SAM-dependent methyltransferase
LQQRNDYRKISRFAQRGPVYSRSALMADDGKVLTRDAPYIPTPQEVVEEMLRIAEVSKNDLLYDLGCGDGRIVITAAQRYGALGVGVDINPKRIKESIYNARRAGVRDRVEFLQQNVFDIDFGNATVVALYLLSSVNMKLRPRLLKDLRPGARIVSHEFNLGDWPPDQELEVEGQPVYYWMVPANAAGIWEWTMQGGGGKYDNYVLQLNQKFQSLTGTLKAGDESIPVTEIVLKGDMLHFAVENEKAGLKMPARFNGRINGDTIQGFMTSDDRAHESTKWTARRLLFKK